MCTHVQTPFPEKLGHFLKWKTNWNLWYLNLLEPLFIRKKYKDKIFCVFAYVACSKTVVTVSIHHPASSSVFASKEFWSLTIYSLYTKGVWTSSPQVGIAWKTIFRFLFNRSCYCDEYRIVTLQQCQTSFSTSYVAP